MMKPDVCVKQASVPCEHQLFPFVQRVRGELRQGCSVDVFVAGKNMHFGEDDT